MNTRKVSVKTLAMLHLGMAVGQALSQTPTHGAYLDLPALPGHSIAPLYSASLAPRTAQLGGSFIENRGQIRDLEGNALPDMRYYAGVQNGVRMYLGEGRISYVFARNDSVDGDNTTAFGRAAQLHGRTASPVKQTLYRMDMRLVGANNVCEIVHDGESQARFNYYYAHCPQGITGVRAFSTITYKSVYPNIDVVFRRYDNRVKYDFVVRPGGNPSAIKMEFVGARSVVTTAQGRINIAGPLGNIEEDVPFTYQPPSSASSAPTPADANSNSAGGSHQIVPAAYRVGGRAVSFSIGTYDHSRTLIIDPALSWCTFYGGSSDDGIGGVSIDGSNSIISVGATLSNDMPGTAGAFQSMVGGKQDAIAAKFDTYGVLMWATYYGGTDYDAATSSAVDGSDNVYVTGLTRSTNFPVSTGAFQTSFGGVNDAFICKLNSNGIRQWASYCGGGSYEEGYSIAVDGSGNAIVAGSTGSTNFPATAGAFQTTLKGTGNAFVIKFDGSGNRKWATYYGGSGGDGAEGVAVTSSGDIFLTGSTSSTDFPTTAGAFQATNNAPNNNCFLVKFDANGNQKWSTYYGGPNGADAYAVAADVSGNVFMVGNTWDKNFPVSAAAYQTTYGGKGDPFIVKFDGSGGRKWATYYGGNDNELVQSVTTDGSGNVLFTGWTGGAGTFPTTSDAFQSGLTGWTGSGATFWAAFIVELDGSGTRKWATEFGSTDGGQVGTYGGGIAVDQNGSIIVAGGTTSSASAFPVTYGAYQTTNHGGQDGFIAKFCMNTPTYTQSITRDTICRGSTARIGNGTASGGSGSYTYSWTPTKWLSASNVVGPISTPDSTITYYEEICDSYGCCVYDSTVVIVHQLPVAVAGTDRTICPGTSTKLGGLATGGKTPYRYQWSPAAGVDDITLAMPTVTPAVNTTYIVTVTDSNGCQGRDTVVVSLFPKPLAHAGAGIAYCMGDSGQLAGLPATGGAPPFAYQWTPAYGLSSTSTLTPRAFPDSTVHYTLTVTDGNGCTGKDTVTVTVHTRPHVNVNALADQTICGNTSIVIGGPASGGTPPYTYLWTPAAGLSAANVAAPVAQPAVTTSYTVVVTDAFGCTDRGQMLLRVFPAPHPTVTASVAALCPGDSAVLTCDSGYTAYLWNTGAKTRSVRVGDAKAYTVTVTGANGCKGTSAPVSVRMRPRPATPVITVTGDTGFCAGGSASLSVPPGARAYLWSNGSSQPSIIVTTPGRYTVTVTGDSGCTATSAPVTITVFPLPAPVVVGPTEVCRNSTVSYTATDSATPTEAKSYTWTVSAGGTITSGAATATITVRWSAAGQEQVSVVATTQSRHCTGTSKALTVSVGSSLKPTIAAVRGLVLCGADTLVLDAGKGYATYAWSTGATTESITVTTPGKYTVRVADATGCSGSSDTVTVITGAPPAPVVSGPDTVCMQTSAQYTTADNAGDTYAWTVTGGAITSGTSTHAVTVQWGAAGTGTLSVTENRGRCTGTSGVSVAIGTGVHPPVTPSGPVTFCVGDSVTLTAPAGFTAYLWSTGESTASIVVKTSGTYTVSVTGAGGCTGTSSPVTVSVGTTLVPEITGRGAFCAGDSTVLDAGAGYDTYAWSTGAATERINVSTAGAYTVAVTKGSCAGTSALFPVVVYPAPARPVITAGVGDTLVSTAAATYQWLLNNTAIAGATGQRVSARQQGDYAVEITDSNGCTATSAVYTVTQQSVLAHLCVRVDPRELMPLDVMMATVTLDTIVSAPVDSITVDMAYDYTLFQPLEWTSPWCTVRAVPLGRGVLHMTLGVCGMPLASGDLCQVLLRAVVSSQDTARTAIVVGDARFYPMDSAPSVTPCVDSVLIKPLCGLHGVRYTGATTLTQNYPNPASGTTTMRVTLAARDAAGARLTVRDMLGNVVRDLTDIVRPDGVVTFETGAMPSGVYVCALEYAGGRITREMLVIK